LKLENKRNDGPSFRSIDQQKIAKKTGQRKESRIARVKIVLVNAISLSKAGGRNKKKRKIEHGKILAKTQATSLKFVLNAFRRKKRQG